MPSLSLPNAPQPVTLLPDLALPSLSRPLSLLAGHTYAAIWPFVSRGPSPRAITRELILVRDDGQLLFAPSQPRAGQPPPALDWFLPSRPPLPADRLWSGDGVQRYLDGYRPNPSSVFARLVSVLNQFVDFNGSVGPPDLMAEFFAVYLLTTWFAPAFPFHGLLWLLGDNGAGKSRLLSLLARLAHLGLYLPVLPPGPALRQLASLGATLAVDDAGYLAASARRGQWPLPARYALLLAGRQRGALLPITLAEPRRLASVSHTRQLDVSGPRLFANVQPPHSTVARYFIVVPLVRTPLAVLAAADPADSSAWPAGLTLASLVDDLWALALSRLHELPPHLPLAAQAAASPQPSSAAAPAIPLLGANLQPWHALLATASWLSASGVPGLLPRLLGLAQAYHAARPAPQTADLTILCLRALLACVSASYQRTVNWATTEAFAAYDRAHGIDHQDNLDNDADDGASAHGGFVANSIFRALSPRQTAAPDHDADDDDTVSDADDAETQNILRRYQLRADRDAWRLAYVANPDRALPPFPSSVSVTSAEVLDAMRLHAGDQDLELALASLTPSLVGQRLRQLGLRPHRYSSSRRWLITPAALARLARAYGVSLPPDLIPHFPSADSPLASHR